MQNENTPDIASEEIENAQVDSTEIKDPLLGEQVIERDNDFSLSAEPLPSQDEEEVFNEMLQNMSHSGLDTSWEDDDLEGDMGEASIDDSDLKSMEVNSSEDLGDLMGKLSEEGFNAPASEVIWNMAEKTIPELASEFLIIDKLEVNKILRPAGLSCDAELLDGIKAINEELEEGLKVKQWQTDIGKPLLKEVFEKKGIEKKISPEMTLLMLMGVIAISWFVAIKKHKREKDDLYGSLKDLVAQKLKLDKMNAEKAPPEKDKKTQ